jgi:hypothetical protein
MWGGQGPYKDCRATGDYDNYHNNAFVFASFNEIISVEMSVMFLQDLVQYSINEKFWWTAFWQVYN